MTVAEVREVMRRLWSNCSGLLKHLYALDRKLGRVGHATLSQSTPPSLQSQTSFKEAYHMFFVQTVLVPPNNVRPLSKMGELTFEHPQNTALTQASTFQNTPSLIRPASYETAQQRFNAWMQWESPNLLQDKHIVFQRAICVTTLQTASG